MLLAHDVALALGVPVADREILQTCGVEGKQLLEIRARSFRTCRHAVDINCRAPAGPAIGVAPREEAQRNLLMCGIAPDQHQMLEIVGESAAFATGLVNTARTDDHLEPGRRARLVADEKQMLTQAAAAAQAGSARARRSAHGASHCRKRHVMPRLRRPYPSETITSDRS